MLKRVLGAVVNAWLEYWSEYWSVEPCDLLRGSRSLAIKRLLEK